MIEKEILQNYIEGNATNDEIELVVEWLDSSEDNVQELIKLRKLNNISLFNEPVKEVKKRNKPYKKYLIEFAKVAAVFMIFLIGNYFLNNNQESNSQTLTIPSGQRAELLLPDSSIVWVNALSKITYSSDFGKNNRIVELDGEAFFKVKKDPKLTFVVKTKEVDITVLGTEFNVIAYQGAPITEVSLISGSIEIKGPKIPNGKMTMSANNYIKIDGNNFHAFSIKDYDYFRWKEGLLCFNNEPIENIMKKLELYYDTRIDVQKKSLLKLPYTGKFRAKDGIERVLKVLQLEHTFTYTVNKELNLITINPE